MIKENNETGFAFYSCQWHSIGKLSEVLNYFQDEYQVKAIPLIGMNPAYPITKDWRYLVNEVIQDIQQQSPDQKVIGLGHSLVV